MSGSSAEPQQGGPPAGPKKTSPWIFVLIGCAGLIVIAGVAAVALGVFAVHKAREAGIDPDLMREKPALAAAKLIAAANPDVEVIAVDENTERITFREKSTGKTVTLNLDQVKQGRISFESEEGGEVTLESSGEGAMTVTSPEGTMQMGSAASATLPAWLKAYPGSASQGVVSSETADGRSGTVAFQTKDSAEAAVKFYRQALESAGLKVTTMQESGAAAGGMVNGESEDGKRSAAVIITSGENGVSIHVTFQEKK